MGYDADAYLLFGFVLTEEEVDLARDEGGDVDWEEWFAAKVGITHPGVPYGEDVKPLFSAYWDAKRNAVADSGVEVERTGWCEEPVYVVTVRDATVRACYGDIETFTPRCGLQGQYEDRLATWCQTTGIAWRQPQWLLANFLSY